jgi:hypothetical protein
VEYFSHFFEKPWKEMFDGMAVLVPEMPRQYVPQLFLLKEPEIFLALGVAGTAGALVAAMRRDIATSRRAIYLLLAFAGVFPIVLAVLTKPAMYNGIRHFVFVAPPLAVLGGLAGAWIGDALLGRSRRAAGLAVAVLVVGLFLPVREMVRLHPYQYTHFNVLAGGIRAADDRYMLDYWGLSFKQAAQELRARLTEGLQTPTDGRHSSWPRTPRAPISPSPWANSTAPTSRRPSWSRSSARASSMPASTTSAAAPSRT